MATIKTLLRMELPQISGRSLKFHCFFDNNTDQWIFSSALDAYEDWMVELLGTLSSSILPRFYATDVPLVTVQVDPTGARGMTPPSRSAEDIAADTERERLLHLADSTTSPAALRWDRHMWPPVGGERARIWVKVDGSYHATLIDTCSTSSHVKGQLSSDLAMSCWDMQLSFNKETLGNDRVLMERGVFGEASLQLS